MKLSVIVNHYHTPEILKICLRSIEKNLKNADFDWEIILADIAADEKTFEVVNEHFPSVVFVPIKENVGFGKSVNIALGKAKGDYVFIVNADIIIDEEKAIEKMLKYLEEHEDVGEVGPKLLNVNGTVQESCFRFYTPLTVICRRTVLGKVSFGKKILDEFLMRDIFEKEEITKPISVDWLMGSAIMARKADLERIGGFDERFFMYFEDVDLSRRFWESGKKVVYFPQAVMYHYHFQSSKRKSLLYSLFSKYARIHIKSALKYFLKYGGGKPPRYGK